MSVARSQRSYGKSPSKGGGSPRHPAVRVDDSPIQEFVQVIDNTPQGAWQKRTTAFESLIKQIPEGSAYHAFPAWYNNPPTLRHLANPLSELLKDPRSTVVKRTCGSVLTLFSRCQSDARYLFKDMMPTILSVHAQTVQVIRQAVQFMVMEAIPEVPCKMVMPLWMERLKIDKSRTVRDACALYLGQALQCWTDEGYLTEEIWMQVGKALVASLRDPSPAVRTNAKAALENMQRMQPIYFDNMVSDPEGQAAQDPKLSRWLMALGQGGNPDTEELSVMSRFSYNSEVPSTTARSKISSGASVGSNNPRRPSPSPRHSTTNQGVPKSIALGGSARANGDRAIPSGSSVSPRPTATANGGKPTGLAPPTPSRRSELIGRRSTDDNAAMPSTPSRAATAVPKDYSTPDQQLTSPMGDSVSPMQPGSPENGETPGLNTSGATAADKEPLSPSAFPSDLGVPTLRQSMQSSSSSSSSPPTKRIHSTPPVDERQSMSGVVSPSLTKAAVAASSRSASSSSGAAEAAPGPEVGGEAPTFSERRNRNSVLILQRLKKSSSDLDSSTEWKDVKKAEESRNGHRPPKKISASPSTALGSSPMGGIPPPEHMIIAIRLLKAHKAHVDAIMETLRIEMDTLRDFDRLLEEPGRPTEEEVLDYFESVGLCLEQRTVAGVQMQEELDRVSRGEPPNE